MSEKLPSLAGLVFLLLCGLVVSPAEATATTCFTDPETALPLPYTVPGVCVTGSGSSLRLIQVGGNGLMIVAPVAEAATDHDSRVLLHNQNALLLYCPTSVMDPATGSPGPECLRDFETLLPGRSALLGFGVVQASLGVEQGRLACPSALHVLAEVGNFGGDRFDLRGSLILSENSEPRPGELSSTARAEGSCGTVFEEISLSNRRRTVTASELETVSSNPEALVAELDPVQWQVIDELVKLDDDDLKFLQHLLGVAPETSDPAEVDGFFNHDNIGNRVTQTLNRVKTIQARVNDLRARIPDRPGLRDSFKQVGVQDLRSVLDLVNQEIRGIVALALELRSGFKDWNGSDADPCGAGSRCRALKDDLNRLLDDLEDAYDFVTSVSCLDNPAPFERRGLETGFVRQLLDKTPDVALFVLEKILDGTVPNRKSTPGLDSGVGGWRTMIRDVLDALPADLVEEIRDTCTENPSFDAAAIGGGDPIRCRVLRPPEIELALKTAQGVGKVADPLASIINRIYTPKDKEITLEGVVGAGGGAGTNFPDPIKILTEILEFLGKKLGSDKAQSIFEDLLDKRDDCLDTDKDIEEDLRDCDPRASYFLGATLPPFPRPTYRQVEQHVEREISQAERCQNRGGCAHADLTAAQSKLEMGSTIEDTPLGFKYLCDAHCEIIDGPDCNRATATHGGGAPEQCRNGTDDDGDGLIDCDDEDCSSRPFCSR